MNRSLSQSFKSKSNKKNYLAQNTSNFSFNTVWKFRNGHQSKLASCQNTNQIIKNQSMKRNHSFCLRKSAIDNSEKMQQEALKKFIKNMKIEENNTGSKQQQIKKPETAQSGRSMIKSRLITQKNVEPDELTRMEHLQNYERRLEELIKMKIMKKNAHNKLFITRKYQDQFQKQLKQMIQQIQLLGSNEEAQYINEKIDLQLEQVQKRIVLYEKLIAESLTESQVHNVNIQMLKRYYYSKRATKSSGTKIRNDFSFKIQKQQNTIFASSLGSKTAVNYETTNQFCYKKPAKQNYKKSQRMTQSYIHNRQPFPRSMYQKQFLNYGALPTYKFNVSEDYVGSNCHSQQFRQSMYRNDFREHSLAFTSQQNLDCKINKIKTSNISFMPKKSINQIVCKDQRKDELLKKSKKDRKALQSAKNNQDSKQNKENKQSIENKQNCLNQSRIFKTKFIGQTQKQAAFNHKKLGIQSVVKDKNLNLFKYTFRNMGFV